MQSVLGPFRRVPPHCSVTCNAGPSQGPGTVWNFSRSCWRLSGNLPIQSGESRSLTVTPPNAQRIEVSEAVVQWPGGQDFAVEDVVVDPHTHACVQYDVKRLVQQSMEIVR